MENFPSNARSPKSARMETPENVEHEQPRARRIIEGEVIRRKKSPGKRFTEKFMRDAKGVWSFVFMEVLIPAARDMVVDAGQQALERTFYGETRGGGRRGRGSAPTPYNRFSTPSKALGYRDDPRPPLSRRARATHNFDEVVLPTRREAEDVINEMFAVAERYNQVTVGDLYDILNITADFPDRKYGWTDLSGFSVSRVREGYLLDLPRPEPLD